MQQKSMFFFRIQFQRLNGNLLKSKLQFVKFYIDNCKTNYVQKYICNLLKQSEVNMYVDCMIKSDSKYHFCCIERFLKLPLSVLLIVFQIYIIVSIRLSLFHSIAFCFNELKFVSNLTTASLIC